MAAEDRSLYPRFCVERLIDALADTPVVAVNGARQVGKSTLVTTLLDRSPSAIVVTLDDLSQRQAASADPRSFVDRSAQLIIDEVQRVPELLPAIKAAVDRDRRPGRFILTGSTRLLSIAEVSESLPGRVEIVDLAPLSQGEIERSREGFIDALFAWDATLSVGSNLDKADYFERLCAGGFPEPLARSGRRRQAWFANYATTVVERMVADIADVQRLAAMPQLLQLCAARTSAVLNTRNLADDLGLPYRTVGSYLAHLRAVFLVTLLPAWSRNLTSKVAHRPKIHLADSGLAAHLVDMDPLTLAESAAPGGAVLETFVVAEVLKQLGWSAIDASAYHFRDRGGAEVDLVLEARNGAVAGVEVKASSTVRSSDFRGLRLLAERLGHQFAGGVVLYTGPDPVPFGERLLALPVSALWQVSPSLGAA